MPLGIQIKYNGVYQARLVAKGLVKSQAWT